MRDPLGGPDALAAWRARSRELPPDQRILDLKLVAGFLRGEAGGKLLDLLEHHFDGDTFAADPYEHAKNAGARSVYLVLKDLKKENPDA